MNEALADAKRMPKAGWRLTYDVLYWTPFWIVPELVAFLNGQWADNKDVAISIAITGGLIAAGNLFDRRMHYFYLIAGLLVWAGACASIVFLMGAGDRPSGAVIVTALDAGTGDIWDFISRKLGVLFVLAILAMSAPFALLFVRWKNPLPALNRLWILLLALVFLAPLGIKIAKQANRLQTGGNLSRAHSSILTSAYRRYPPLRPYVALGDAVVARHVLAATNINPSPRVTITTPDKSLTLIVIVGESLDRHHMSLYGYCRKTTPGLDSLSNALIRFDQVTSPIPSTTIALAGTFLLQGAGKRNAGTTLINMLNAARFDTYWFSNQTRVGILSTQMETITGPAHHQFFTNVANDVFAQYVKSWDGQLMPPLRAALHSGGKRAIFVHLMGSHLDYTHRVPPNFANIKFPALRTKRTPDQLATIDAYDRTVRYTDSIVSQIIHDASQIRGDVAVVFFSDHGDQVYDTINYFGHGYPNVTHETMDIPMLVYLSPAFRNDRPDVVKNLFATKGNKLNVENGDLAALLMEITGVRPAGAPALNNPAAISEPRHKPLAILGIDTPPRFQKTIYPPLCPARNSSVSKNAVRN